MRHDAWRREAASYPLRGTLMPRYSDVDIWQHMNNSALITLQGEAVQGGLRSVLGPDAWRNSQPVLGCVANATDFLAEAYYPDALEWGARVVGADARGLRIATALFQKDQCVGLHEASFLGWHEGQAVGLGAQQLATLQAAGVPLADGLGADFVPHGIPAVPDPDHFPWQQMVDIRFGDNDARRLASDMWLARCAEQMRVAFLNHVYGPQRQTRGGMMVAHVALHWVRRTMPSARWALACGVAHMGERSLAVRGAIYEAGQCVATCESVMVAIDRETRRSAPLSDEARAQLEAYRLKEAGAL